MKKLPLVFIVLALLSCDSSEPRAPSTNHGVGYAGVQNDAQPNLPEGVFLMRRVGIIDPIGFAKPTVAFTGLIPEGWLTYGGVLWRMEPNLCASSGATTNWIATAPDGSMGAMFFPGMAWGTSNTGKQVAAGCPRLNLTTVRQYLEFVVQQSRPNATILDFRARPDIDQQFQQPQQTQQLAMGQSQKWTETGELLIAYQQGARDFRETLTATVFFTRMTMQGPIMMDTLIAEAPDGYAFRALNGTLDFKFADTIRASFTVTPRWEKLLQGYRTVLDGIIARAAEQNRNALFRTWEDISAMRQSSFELWNNTNDRRYRQFSDAMRGLDRYQDPLSLTGEVQLSNQWRNAYRLDNGLYAVSDQISLNPYQAFGQNATKLRKAQ